MGEDIEPVCFQKVMETEEIAGADTAHDRESMQQWESMRIADDGHRENGGACPPGNRSVVPGILRVVLDAKHVNGRGSAGFGERTVSTDTMIEPSAARRALAAEGEVAASAVFECATGQTVTAEGILATGAIAI